jgi:thermitase
MHHRSSRVVAAAAVACAMATLTMPVFGARVTAKTGPVTAEATQLIVRFDAVTSVEAINSAAGTVTEAASVGSTGTYLIELPAGGDAGAAQAAIAAVPGVAWVAPNLPIDPPEVDQSRIYAWRIYAWAIGDALPDAGVYAPEAIKLPAALQTSTGAGVVVAVLDTGVQLEPGPHPALAGSLVPGTDLIDGDAIPNETRNGIDDDGDGLIDEGSGHGTHVAGIVHQAAPDARIMPVRVLDDDGTGSQWTVAEGMYWAADHGANIINLSLGTHGSASVLREAVEEVTDQGVLVVAAAGNDGRDRRMFPAAAPDAIAVGSVGVGDISSTFSNFGRWIDVVAPGEDIHSSYAFPNDSYASTSGTSMASPWVAGEAALLLSRNPTLSPAALSSAITRGAKRIDGLNPTRIGGLGAGRIDLAASLALISP